MTAQKTDRTQLAGYKQLKAAGFTDIKPLGTRQRYSGYGIDSKGNITDPLLGSAEYGKWFECDVPRATLQIAPTSERVLILRQSANIWHAFYVYRATGSGPSCLYALSGGLGDAISTDGELKSYSRLVRRAPETWADRFEGLNAAKQQVYNDSQR